MGSGHCSELRIAGDGAGEKWEQRQEVLQGPFPCCAPAERCCSAWDAPGHPEQRTVMEVAAASPASWQQGRIPAVGFLSSLGCR